jgi:hypothetical protein
VSTIVIRKMYHNTRVPEGKLGNICGICKNRKKINMEGYFEECSTLKRKYTQMQ